MSDSLIGACVVEFARKRGTVRVEGHVTETTISRSLAFPDFENATAPTFDARRGPQVMELTMEVDRYLFTSPTKPRRKPKKKAVKRRKVSHTSKRGKKTGRRRR